LLKEYGIPVPWGVLAHTPSEAAAALDGWSQGAMIKGQVLSGGRGKAGAIRAVSSKEQAKSTAQDILAISVKDFPVQQVLVTEKISIKAEYYVAVTVDRQTKSAVLIVSDAGGMEIEDIALNEPRKIRRFTMCGADTYKTESLKQWLSLSFPDQSLLDQALKIIQNMYRLFNEKDCSLVEINPLAVTTQDQLTAADAKIVFDDNGIAKHPDVERLRNPEENTADELEAKKAGLSFVSLSGQIGCMVNGAGLAMATMDGIKLAGGSAANFMDVGGSSNPEKILNAMRILQKNEKLKSILINIFGGITRCDDVAQGILMARKELNITVPIVIRLVGTNEKKGHDILREAGMIVSTSMTDAIADAVCLTNKGKS
jgi:succinyl-CoA synthetase beta subunit